MLTHFRSCALLGPERPRAHISSMSSTNDGLTYGWFVMSQPVREAFPMSPLLTVALPPKPS